MANYEFMLIMDPSLSETDRESSIENLKDILKKYSTKVTKEDIWWEKKLAYKINKSEKGFYVLYELDLDGTNIKNISKEMNLDKNIWRYMFVKQES